MEKIPQAATEVGELAELMARVTRSMRRALGRRIETLGMTHGRMRALRRLAASGEPSRMGELAAALGVVPRSATSVVEDLVAGGWVRRRSDATDRRVVLLEVTPLGRRVLEACESLRREVAEETLGGLSDSSRRRLRRLLVEILES